MKEGLQCAYVLFKQGISRYTWDPFRTLTWCHTLHLIGSAVLSPYRGQLTVIPARPRPCHTHSAKVLVLLPPLCCLRLPPNPPRSSSGISVSVTPFLPRPSTSPPFPAHLPAEIADDERRHPERQCRTGVRRSRYDANRRGLVGHGHVAGCVERPVQGVRHVGWRLGCHLPWGSKL